MTYAQGCAESLSAIGGCRPRVHCITNAVAMTYTANTLLAVGAIPSMSLAPGEIGDFVSNADSLSVNIGTLDRQRRKAIARAIEVALGQGKPWVLDPVFVNLSRHRRRYAAALLERLPAVIRGNSAEIAVLAERQDESAARWLARSAGSIVVQTGTVDVVTDGRLTVGVANGHPLMARVTAMGCVLSALIGAFLVVERDPLAAAVQAVLAMGVAGQRAAALSSGPGSVQVAILDELFAMNAETLVREARVSILEF